MKTLNQTNTHELSGAQEEKMQNRKCNCGRGELVYDHEERGEAHYICSYCGYEEVQ